VCRHECAGTVNHPIPLSSIHAIMCLHSPLTHSLDSIPFIPFAFDILLYLSLPIANTTTLSICPALLICFCEANFPSVCPQFYLYTQYSSSTQRSLKFNCNLDLYYCLFTIWEFLYFSACPANVHINMATLMYINVGMAEKLL